MDEIANYTHFFLFVYKQYKAGKLYTVQCTVVFFKSIYLIFV